MFVSSWKKYAHTQIVEIPFVRHFYVNSVFFSFIIMFSLSSVWIVVFFYLF